MNNWNEKIKIASDYLDKAEQSLKEGDEIQGCIKQRKAAEYGIDATNSLIKAFQERDPNYDMSDIETGLAKWKELRDFC